jgi:hypothetical protein
MGSSGDLTSLPLKVDFIDHVIGDNTSAPASPRWSIDGAISTEEVTWRDYPSSHSTVRGGPLHLPTGHSRLTSLMTSQARRSTDASQSMNAARS